MNKYARIALLIGAASLAHGKAAQAQHLTMAVTAPVTTFDPQYKNNLGDKQFSSAIFETLIDRDTKGQLIPSLATSWQTIDDTTWEFKLRPGVTFHNGNSFTAEDVAFSLDRVPNLEKSPQPYTTYTASIKSVEAVDPLTVRITTHAPNPALPIEIAAIYMMDQETHKGVSTNDFNRPEIVVGTGVYKLFANRKEEIELTRNDNYWGELGSWERVTYRIIENDAARTAALLSGSVQFIDNVPPTNVDRINSRKNLTVVRYDGVRPMLINIDQSGQGQFAFTNEGAKLPPEVLKDLRVRKALSIAIDRKAIAEKVMEKVAIPTGQLLPPGGVGFVPDIEVPTVNVEEARRLLAEAGYPDGFRITLHGPNGMYRNDVDVIQAVAQMWTRIGVKTEVVAMPFSNFVSRAAQQELSAFMTSWGQSTVEAGNTLRMLIHTFEPDTGLGSINRHRYSNARVDELIAQFSSEMDPDKRLKQIEEAVRVSMNDIAVIPLVILTNIAAIDKSLTYSGRVDGHVRINEIHPAVVK